MKNYINLKNFNDTKLEVYNDIFEQVKENVVICIYNDIINNNNKLLEQIKSKTCFIDCSDDWETKKKEIIDDPIDGCKCKIDNCLSCAPLNLNKRLCTKCNNNYYPIENEISNIEGYINCYKETMKGYYLDKIANLIKKCYYRCETCERGGDNKIHNCITCNNNYTFNISYNNYYNCYENCNYYYYFDSENTYYCTTNASCPKEYPVLVKSECIRYGINNLIQDILNIETNETKEKNKEEEIEYYDTIIKNVEMAFTSENYDTSKLDNGEDEVITTEKMTVTFTTTQSQKNNIKKF